MHYWSLSMSANAYALQNINSMKNSLGLSSWRTSKGKTEGFKGRGRACSKEMREERTREQERERERNAFLFWCRARAIWQNDFLLWYLFLLRLSNDRRFIRVEVVSLINERRNKSHQFYNRYQRYRSIDVPTT